MMSFLDEYRDKFEEEGGPSFSYEKFSQTLYASHSKLYRTISKELNSIQNIPSKVTEDENLLILFSDDDISITTTKPCNNIARIIFEREKLYSILEHGRLLGVIWKAFIICYHSGTLSNYHAYDRDNRVPFTFEDLAAILISRGF